MKWYHYAGIAVLGAIIVKHLAFAKVAKPWRSMIDQAAKKHNVNPHVIAAIIYKESSFNPAAVGTSGEIGLGQFLPIAAKDIGRDISELRDNPEVQIDSTAALVALNLKRSGDIFTSVRAYNAGIGAALKSATAGLTYAIDVMETALADWLYGLLSKY